MVTLNVYIFLSILFLILLLHFICYRVNWITLNRWRILKNDLLNGVEDFLSEYERLPSKKTMFLKFWIWDIEKFKAKEKKFERYH